eukprot:TRINITY_DN38922_c0_g1_i1.p1 TRINITY_DN38922_c0_g1~~TRINITY_DN38922_c0_g1_i1.p1  ORF type:complete len:285 (-),score=38.70 TRINITY_DN38922_c0_g1_i1:707-1507(-)
MILSSLLQAPLLLPPRLPLLTLSTRIRQTWRLEKKVQASSLPMEEAEQRRNAPRIILGSSSRTRRDILTEMGIVFEVKVAGIDESAIRREKAEELVEALALAKAQAIQEKLTAEGEKFGPEDAQHTLLITADQVVTYKGSIREKPRDRQEAEEFIRSYSNSSGKTVGAVLVTNLSTGVREIGTDVTQIDFGEIPNEAVEKLLDERWTYESAGGMMVEHPLVAPYVLRFVDGTIDGVMGLPKALTRVLIKRALDWPPTALFGPAPLD